MDDVTPPQMIANATIADLMADVVDPGFMIM
jgi:hypothetical protein